MEAETQPSGGSTLAAELDLRFFRTSRITNSLYSHIGSTHRTLTVTPCRPTRQIASQAASKARAAELYIWRSALLKPLKPSNRHDSCMSTVSEYAVRSHRQLVRDSAAR